MTSRKLGIRELPVKPKRFKNDNMSYKLSCKNIDNTLIYFSTEGLYTRYNR